MIDSMQNRTIELSVPAHRDMMLVLRLTTAGVVARAGLGVDRINDVKMADQPDGVTMIDIPTTNTMFREAIEDMRRTPPYVDPELMRRAKEMYRYLGFPEHIGTECLEMITVLCAQDERRLMGTLDDLEEMIAEIKQIRKRPADRAMRHVIDAAWQSDRVEEQYRVFGDSIDAGRGQPTCREMIARIADILRLEG